MMLTEKECLQAHEILTDMLTVEERQGEEVINKSIIAKDELDLFYKLIHEHFANQSLKWEEIKEDMFVWDNFKKTWIHIYSKEERYKQVIYFELIGWECTEMMEYEPNRFYRKEVQE